MPFDTVIRDHNKAVTATTLLEFVDLDELRIELVGSWELCRVCGRISGEMDGRRWTVFRERVH